MLKILVVVLVAFWFFASVAGIYGIVTSLTRKDRIQNSVVTFLFLLTTALLFGYGWSL